MLHVLVRLLRYVEHIFAELRRAASPSPQSWQNRRHLELLLLRSCTYCTETFCELVRIVVLLIHRRRTALRHKKEHPIPESQGRTNVGIQRHRQHHQRHEISDMTGRQSRPTKDADNAGGLGRTRTAASCLLRTTTSAKIDDVKPVINLDDSFDDGCLRVPEPLQQGTKLTMGIAGATSLSSRVVIIIIVDR